MNGDGLLVNAGSELGPTEGALDAAFGHRELSILCPIAVSAKSGKEEARMVVGAPIAAEQKEGGLRERDVAVFGSLSTVDMDHHAVAVDIGDFEMESFVKSEAAGIDGGEIGVILEGFDAVQNTSDFFNTENGGEALLNTMLFWQSFKVLF